MVAYLALFVALGTGGAWAAATISSGDIKRNAVKSRHIDSGNVRNRDLGANAVGTAKVANDSTPRALSGIDIANESLTGADINDAALPTSGAAQNAAVVTLSNSGTDVVTGQITTTGTSRVLIDASAELTGANADERAQCVVRLDGTLISLGFETTFDDIGTGNEATVSVVASQNNVAAGTHTMTMNCTSLAGTVTKDDAAINAIGIPAQ